MPSSKLDTVRRSMLLAAKNDLPDKSVLTIVNYTMYQIGRLAVLEDNY